MGECALGRARELIVINTTAPAPRNHTRHFQAQVIHDNHIDVVDNDRLNVINVNDGIEVINDDFKLNIEATHYV